MTGSLRIAVADMNGQLRGKRVAPSAAGKAARAPLSIINVDIFGNDIENSPLVFESGDQDGILKPTGRGPVPMPWLGPDATLDRHCMHTEDGSPFASDPHHALQAVLDKYAAKGWTIYAACELEFYLLRGGETPAKLTPATNPKTGRALAMGEVLSIREIDAFDAFFHDIESGARAMGLGDLSISSEAGVGQFEVTLGHVPAMTAAENMLLLKELIKGTAQNHAMTASFMAKPFTDEPGNGLHTHFSVLDGDGQNIFQTPALLEHAVAGCLAAMAPSTVIFAPFGNSFDRFVENAHAPTTPTWGYENRTTALRIPGGPPIARRIEHRVAGGDANPFLLYAAIFGAAMQGIERALTPPAPITGSAYDVPCDLPPLRPTWDAAITDITAPVLCDIFGAELLTNLQRCKRQEYKLLGDMPDHDAKLALLDVV